MDCMGLEGKTVFISGSTRGIGNAIANLFREAGARVVGSGTTSNPVEILDEYFQADFSNLDQIYKCADFVRKISPDILINNAGFNKITPFTQIDPVDFLKIQQVNLFAPFCLCQAALSGMQQRKWGRIVNISSVWGKISKEHRAAYSASKFGLDGMTISLAAEYAQDGILANCIAPGFTDTVLTRSMLGDTGIQKILATVPIKRMASVAEIARFVIWLCGHQNTYITGQNIAIDGGFTRV